MTENMPITVPHASPAYGPPPYYMRAANIVMVQFDVDPQAAQEAMSPPLQFVDGVKASVFIGDMEQLPHCGKFHEGGIIVRAKHKDIEAPYMPYLWTSTDEAVLTGREVYGMPKVLCDDDKLEWSGNQVRGRIKRRGQDVMAVELNIERLLDPEEIGMIKHRLSVRTIPDLKRPGMAIREVLNFPLENYQIHEAWEGRASMELFRTAFSNVHKLQPTAKNFRGYFIRSSWTLNSVEVIDVV